MGNIRKRHSAEFKARVSLEAIQGLENINVISSKYGVSAALISRWKQEAISGLVGVFSKATKSPERAESDEVQRLERKVGQLTMERDFLVEARRKLGLPTRSG
jgi:transposase